MTAAGILTYTFHVNGMHCTACVLLSESELAEHPKVVSAKSSLRTRSVEIRGDFGDRPPEDIAEELADCCIRIFDYCGARNIDLEKTLLKKIDYNKTRPYRHGKKF